MRQVCVLFGLKNADLNSALNVNHDIWPFPAAGFSRSLNGDCLTCWASWASGAPRRRHTAVSVIDGIRRSGQVVHDESFRRRKKKTIYRHLLKLSDASVYLLVIFFLVMPSHPRTKELSDVMNYCWLIYWQVVFITVSFSQMFSVFWSHEMNRVRA